jgi:GntR family transcriptional regulator
MSQARRVFAPQVFATRQSAPLYLRLKFLVQDAIAQGHLKPGDSVPSEREVALLLGISRVTVRKAFTELVNEGVLLQRQGSGTYVRQPKGRIEQPLSRLTSFSEDMKLRGLKTEALWLNRSSGLPTPEEALKLSISPSEHVCRFHRLRHSNDAPLAIELAVVPHRFLNDPMLVGPSLYDTLGSKGFRPVRALQRLHATALQGQEARWLNQPDGSPALFIERISFLPDGRIVEYTRSHYRGDSYDFVAELTLAPESPSSRNPDHARLLNQLTETM